MTLRLRLVIGLVVLVTIGLAVFGVVTYTLYARSQYQRLDDQVHGSIPIVSREVTARAGLGGPLPGGAPPATTAPATSASPSTTTTGTGPTGGGPTPPVVVPPGTYGELRDASDAILSRVQASSSSAQPKLSSGLRARSGSPRLFTTGSVRGSGDWRVAVDTTPRLPGGTVVVAVPMADVQSSLQRLVVIELAAAGGLLAILGVGSWLILRRGLRPLEHMATSARSIAGGELSQRVGPSDERTEVGQLGLALNTMLDEIEAAFRERDATEQRLRQFLADASHELRTPLTSIQGFAELFRLGADEDRVQLGIVLRRIEEETARMKTLVEDLLLLARLDETRPAERAPVDLAVLAADACSDAAAVAPDRPITLDAPEPVVVLGDQDHMRQAIGNLMTNALRYTPERSAIEVGAHVRDGTGVVTVRDHGPGLADDALEHVFDRFWRGDSARAGAGAGLGLAIVAAIADEHGGSATAVNASGDGARFTLELPINAASEE